MIEVIVLNNGATLIGDRSDNPHNVIVSDPMQVFNSREGLALVDYMLMADVKVLNISGEHIVGMYRPSKPIEEYYRRCVKYNTTFSKPAFDKMVMQNINDMEQEERELINELTGLVGTKH